MADLIDLTGQKFGDLTVLKKGNGRKTSGGAYIATWLCECVCGKITEVDGQKLRKGHTTSCGCKRKKNRGSNFKDLTGMKFNKLTVVEHIPKQERTTPTFCWKCRCECGNFTTASTSKLKSGEIKSCGCMKKDRIGNLNRKYKHTNRRLYGVYKGMLNRCFDKRHREYNNYGGRGITVCSDWIGDYGYDHFAEWALSTGYDDRAEYGICTLERKNVDGIYEPGNCCWITNTQQQNNKRTSQFYEYNGESHTKTEWSRILNIPFSFIDYHIKSKKETISETITAYNKRKNKL